MRRLACLTLAALLAAAAAAPAAPPPPVDHGKVQDAIRRGAEYLRKHPVGQDQQSGGQAAGLASLIGLALLEAGLKPDDPSVEAIIHYVRLNAYEQTQTYSVALMAILLDRLNDPADVPLIQLLGCRLQAGQTITGGWGYTTWTAHDEAQVRSAVAPKDPKPIRPQPRPDPNAPPPTPPKLHPEAARVWRAVRAGERIANAGGDDNSNTQFAIVGLWIAQRRGVPCGAAFQGIEARFLRTQSPTDYGWSYRADGGGGSSTPSMTCAGLIGLGAAAAREAGRLPADRADVGDPTKPKKPADDDPFFNPPTGKTGGGDPDAPPPEEKEEAKKTSPIRDAAIERALRAVGQLLKSQTQGGGSPGLGGGGGWGGVSDLYFMWSLERVGAAYGLDTIGDVDWYAWGVERILPGQQADGSWGGNYAGASNTAFALLFLAKSNFVSDLTRNIKGKVKDPGAAELRGTRGGPLALNAGGSTEAVRTPGGGGTGAAGGSGSPDLSLVRQKSAAEKVADGLTTAKDSEWPARLRAAKETKGGPYTQALVLAIPVLEGKRQYQAREALADRLTRMTPDTLKRYLTDRDAELRRAACLACAMKEEKALVRELIERVTDIDDAVVRTAKASLQSLTGQNFGPPPGATDEQKGKALEAWLIWYATEGRGR